MKNIIISLSGTKTLIAIVFVLFSSCNNKQSTTSNQTGCITININPTRVNHINDLVSQIEDISFLPLSNDCPIDQVRKLWFTKDEIMLRTDNDNYQKYDLKGRFILEKTVDGKGKGEIIDLRDFSPGNDGGFYLLGYKNYYHFDRQGKLLGAKTFKIPYDEYNPDEFYIDGNYEVYSNSGACRTIDDIKKNSIYAVDTITGSYQLSLPRLTCTIRGNRFFQCNDKVLISPVVGSDTIFYWSPDKKVSPLYDIDFGNYKINPEEIPVDYETPIPAFSFAKENKKCISISYPLDNEEWLIFYFSYAGEPHRIHYRKSDGKSILLKLEINNLNHILFKGNALAVYKNQFVYGVNALQIVKMFESNTLDFKFLSEARHQEIIAQLKNVKETDNPVLMFVKMKEE